MPSVADEKTVNRHKSSPYLDHSAITGSHVVAVYRDELQVYYVYSQSTGKKWPTSKRGKILGRSKKSRRRMMQVIARAENVDRPIVVTTTFPDEVAFFGFDRVLVEEDVKAIRRAVLQICADEDALHSLSMSMSFNPQAHQMMLKARFAFRKAMRHAYPDTWWFYTIEWAARKTGPFTGYYAPHVHYICFGHHGDLADMRKLINRTWHGILQRLLPGKVFKMIRVDVDPAKHDRAALAYVTKYATKEYNNMVRGWFEDCNITSSGRTWGYFGHYAAPVIVKIHFSRKEFILLRRLTSRYLHNRNREYSRKLKRSPVNQGFSVFGFGATVRDRRLSVPDIPCIKLIMWCVLATG